MNSNSSHQTLKWTRPLIEDLGQEILHGVEAWNQEDTGRQPEQLDSAIEASRQLGGSLSLLDFESGELLGNAMAEMLEVLQRGDFTDEGNALDALMEAAATLPDYLDFLESTHRDAPLLLLPTINKLRAATGTALLNESDFFQPPLDHVQLPETDRTTDINELRRGYQRALPAFLLNNRDQNALEEMAATGLALRDDSSLPESARRAGWAAAAVAASLSSQEIESSADLNRQYASLDALLKQLSEGDSDIDAQADSLCQSFLFSLAVSRPDNDTAAQAWAAFDLDAHAPEAAGQTHAYLAGRNRALFAAVTKAAREDLAQIKDTLGSQLEHTADRDVIESQTELLISVSESLAMLNLDSMAGRLRTQANRLLELDSNPDDPALLAVARELLIVESQLEESLGVIEARALDESDENDGDATLLPPSEWRRVIKQVFAESQEDLAHAKSLLDALNRGKAEPGAAEDASGLLERVSLVLRMAEYHDGANMLAAANRLASDAFSDPAEEAGPNQLETLAEALTVMEFYFDSSARLDDNARRYFDQTRQRLAELGYWPEEPAADAVAEEEMAAEEDAEPAAEQAVPEKPEATEEPGLPHAEDDDTALPAGDIEITAEEPREPEPEPALEESGEESVKTADPAAEDVEDIEASPADTGTGEVQPAQEEETPAQPQPAFSGLDDFDIVAIFLEEFDHELEQLNELLPQWREQPDDEETLTTIRRSFHSLKGSGRMAGAEEIGEFSWQIENMLNRVLEGRLQPQTAVIDIVASAAEMLPSMRARLSGEGEETFDAQACASLARHAEQVADGQVEPEPAEEEPAAAASAPELEGLDSTLVELMVRELSENMETLDAWVAEAETSDRPTPASDALVRAVHTMKGTMRLAPIGSEDDTAQVLELYLEELTHSRQIPEQEGLQAITACQALFRQRLQRLQGEPVPDEVFDTEDLTKTLRQLHANASQDFADISLFPVDDGPQPVPGDSEPIFGLDGGQGDVDDKAAAAGQDEDWPKHATEDDADPLPLDEPVFGLPDTGAEDAPASKAPVDEPWTDEVAAQRTEDTPSAPAAAAPVDSFGSIHDTTPPTDEERADFPPDEPETDEPGAAEDEPAPKADPAVRTPEEPALAPLPEPEPEPEFIELDYAGLDEDLLSAFLEEAEEVLENTDETMQLWREEPDDRALVTNLQRNLHTIKGSSRMVGLDPIGSVAHVMEEILEGIAAGLHQPTEERIDALEAGCDHLHTMVEAVVQRQPMPARPADTSLAATIEDETDVAIPHAEERPAAPADKLEAGPRIERAEILRVPADLVDDLVNFAGEISIFRSRLEEQVNVLGSSVTEIDETVIRLRDQLRNLEIETEAQILARYEREHGPSDGAFDPLELDRYSTIQQLSRALAESVNDLTSLTGIIDTATRQSETLLMQQSRVNTELQEGLMQARMVAFGSLLPRFRRVVRNSARDVGKQVQLTVDIEGDGQLDRTVLERITAPLEHILRNAVSHGIESPDERLAAGKPEIGVIHIDVRREATELVLRVRDDGAGLDLDSIRQQGRERGLLANADGASEQELSQLIFRPGFSTAEEVSELAGRGIGMDVVASEVRQIGGSVSASTETGRGAMFTVRIPLSLTVMQAIMVRVSDRKFAIPLQAVRGVSRMLPAQWEQLIQSDEPVQEYAGEEYPLLELETQLGFAPDDSADSTLSLLMIEAGAHRAALRVAELQGHREIVIKPVGPQISSITGILGGTVTGDGLVVPILDMGPLIRRAFDKNLLPGKTEFYERAAAEAETKRTPLVLVVDDSITMRRVTSRVLEHHGLEVITARDGLDAVETMFERVPDLILLDIEMPRMDGYELATHVRNDPRLKDLPMVMITSRSGEKHRERAREIGVNGYLTKPYQEADLIDEVFNYLNLPVPQG
ncbi:MAG TPA: Hpt domain-containing protein [Wenzhouxiangella sp.]|nr:Hpt domain-containing protein [Wenzhouxiangella sp.]